MVIFLKDKGIMNAHLIKGDMIHREQRVGMVKGRGHEPHGHSGQHHWHWRDILLCCLVRGACITTYLRIISKKYSLCRLLLGVSYFEVKM
jgi:hypothetical protein